MKKIKRILFKISGEALNGEADFLFDSNKVSNIAKMILDLSVNYQLIVVCGAGNIWRHRDNVSLGINRVKSDAIGMMSTLINSSILSQTINSLGGKSIVYTADSVKAGELADSFNVDKINKDLNNGSIVFAAGGTGLPYFTTDSAAALRAAQCNCDLVLKATKVDGVYDKDPFKYPNAKKFDKISFDESIDLNLEIMDQTAFSLCKENDIDIIVFKLDDKTDISKIIAGDLSSVTLITNN